MNLLKTFLGHSRYMNDEPFLKSTRNKFQSQLHHQKKKKKINHKLHYLQISHLV